MNYMINEEYLNGSEEKCKCKEDRKCGCGKGIICGECGFCSNRKCQNSYKESLNENNRII